MELRSIKCMTFALLACCTEAGVDVAVSNYVMTHYNTLIALKAAIEKAGKVDKEAMVDAMAGLVTSPTGPVTIDQNHHTTMNMFIAKTWGRDRSPRGGRDYAAAGMQIG
jgi:ABC-type branched-subunit amino acid transport system substrate-binding protein